VYNPNPSPSSIQKRPSIIDAPCTTPHPQSLTLTYRKRTFKFIDTPGLSFIPPVPAPSSTTDTDDEELRRQTRLAHDILLRNRGNISKLNNPLPAASYIFHRAALADLLVLYNLPAVAEGDLEAFLGSLARKEGALHKRGAVVDLVGASRALVRDWKSGRLGCYTLPPSSGKKEEGGEGEADEKLRTMYAMDEKSLTAAGALPRKEIRRVRGGLVQLSSGKIDERSVDLEANVELEMEDDSDEEAEVTFEPKVKGGILKAPRGKKKKPEPESDEDEDDQSDGETQEDEGGPSGSEEEDNMAVDEEVERLPVLPARLSGKDKRETRREDKDKARAKRVTFEASTKNATKSKPTGPAPKKSGAKGKVGKVGAGKTTGGGRGSGMEEDTYDFSRYFQV
jgi:nuclear GTP-binding protein